MYATPDGNENVFHLTKTAKCGIMADGKQLLIKYIMLNREKYVNLIKYCMKTFTNVKFLVK